MDCKNIFKILREYTDGRLDETRAVIVKNHIEKCARCHRYARELTQSSKQQNGSLSVKTSSSSHRRILVLLSMFGLILLGFSLMRNGALHKWIQDLIEKPDEMPLTRIVEVAQPDGDSKDDSGMGEQSRIKNSEAPDSASIAESDIISETPVQTGLDNTVVDSMVKNEVEIPKSDREIQAEKFRKSQTLLELAYGSLGDDVGEDVSKDVTEDAVSLAHIQTQTGYKNASEACEDAEFRLQDVIVWMYQGTYMEWHQGEVTQGNYTCDEWDVIIQGQTRGRFDKTRDILIWKGLELKRSLNHPDRNLFRIHQRLIEDTGTVGSS